MQRSRHLGLLLAAAALGAAALPGGARVVVADGQQVRSATTATTVQTAGQSVSVFQQAGDFDRWWSQHRATRRSGYRNGPGWTNRHVQRMARKRRNQARHRAACR